MRILDSVYLMRIARSLDRLSQLAAKGDTQRVRPDMAAQVLTLIADLRGSLEPVELPVTIAYLDRLEVTFSSEKLPTYQELAYSAAELVMRVEDELKSCVVLQIPRGRASYYGKADLFGAEVSTRFPQAVGDIDEAANCYAFGRATAAVFHLMRALEACLQELAKTFTITLDPKKQDWQDIVDAIRTYSKNLPARNDVERNDVKRSRRLPPTWRL